MSDVFLQYIHLSQNYEILSISRISHISQYDWCNFYDTFISLPLKDRNVFKHVLHDVVNTQPKHSLLDHKRMSDAVFWYTITALEPIYVSRTLNTGPCINDFWADDLFLLLFPSSSLFLLLFPHSSRLLLPSREHALTTRNANNKWRQDLEKKKWSRIDQKATHFWQWAKQIRLYSDLHRALKWEPLPVLGS